MLTEVWKDEKTKENMKEIKEKEISDMLHWGLGVVPKSDDDIYVSISIGKYIFLPVFCIVSKKVVLLKISKMR